MSIMRVFLTMIAVMAAMTSGARTIMLDTISAHPGTPEGIWAVPGGGIFRISASPTRTGIYELFVVAAPGCDIACDAPMGTMRAGARGHVFDAELLSDPRHGAKQKPRSFMLEFDEKFQTVVFKPYSRSWRVNITRLLPYFFRLSVERPGEKPTGLEAAVRMAPHPVVTL